MSSSVTVTSDFSGNAQVTVNTDDTDSTKATVNVQQAVTDVDIDPEFNIGVPGTGSDPGAVDVSGVDGLPPSVDDLDQALEYIIVNQSNINIEEW